MYTLTLTSSERKAIDWVGNRYSNGDELYKLLVCSVWPFDLETRKVIDDTEEGIDWSSNCDITFGINEPEAWTIKDNSENEDGYWPCFSSELANKMQKFVDNIV